MFVKSAKIARLAFALVAMAFPGAATAETVLGNWSRGDGEARVRIAPCGGALCAINTWIRDESKGEHVGDRLVMQVTGDRASKMSGKAFDPQRDLTYSVDIDVSGDTMRTRGCMLAGILCKTVEWTRISREAKSGR